MSTQEQQAAGADNNTNNDPEYTPNHLDLEGFDDAVIESEPVIDPDTNGKPNREPGAEDDPGEQLDNDNDDDTSTDDGEGKQSDSENVFMFGDEEIQPGEAAKETPREKELREEVERLKAQTKQQPTEQPELAEPGLYDDGIEGDPEKHQAALAQYYRELGKREAMQERETQEREARRQQDQARFKESVALYGQRMAQVKSTLPDIDQADDFLGRELPQLHQTALFSAGVENPEMVAYALYKNKDLREAFAKEQNPFRLGMMVADISKKARLAPKGQPKQLEKEPQPRGTATGAHPNKYGLTGDLADAVLE